MTVPEEALRAYAQLRDRLLAALIVDFDAHLEHPLTTDWRNPEIDQVLQ